MKTVPAHELRFFLSSERVDPESGVIYGVTVGKAGVRAQGHSVMYDGNGDMTKDPAQAKKRYPMMTDDETLITLMSAAEAAGGRLKCREDHDDSIGARAGYIDNFRVIGDRAVGDVHLFASYRNRAIVLETARETPGEIGLSIDFNPRFEIRGNEAFMRVSQLEAVDIVDEGAITPGGMFCRKGVDNENKVITSKKSTMADDKKDPSLSECMAAITALAANVSQLAASIKPAKADNDGEEASSKTLSAVNEVSVQLTKLSEKVTAIETTHAADIVELKKQNAALGLRVGGEGGKGGSADSAGEAERVRLAKLAEEDKNKPKTYLELVAAARKADTSLSESKAFRDVMRANPEAYAAHLASKGVANIQLRKAS